MFLIILLFYFKRNLINCNLTNDTFSNQEHVFDEVGYKTKFIWLKIIFLQIVFYKFFSENGSNWSFVQTLLQQFKI